MVQINTTYLPKAREGNSIPFSRVQKLSPQRLDEIMDKPVDHDFSTAYTTVERTPVSGRRTMQEDRYNKIAAKYGLNHDDVEDQAGHVDTMEVKALADGIPAEHYVTREPSKRMVDVTHIQDDVTPVLHVPMKTGLYDDINSSAKWQSIAGWRPKTAHRLHKAQHNRWRGYKRTNNQHFKYQASFMLYLLD